MAAGAPGPPGVGGAAARSSRHYHRGVRGDMVMGPSTQCPCWGPPRLPPPVVLSPNAYADHLRGLVIPTPENLNFEVTQAVMLREFASRCNRVTDLHFAPLTEQLQAVNRSTASAPLKSGDYLKSEGMLLRLFQTNFGRWEPSIPLDLARCYHGMKEFNKCREWIDKAFEMCPLMIEIQSQREAWSEESWFHNNT